MNAHERAATFSTEHYRMVDVGVRNIKVLIISALII